MKFVFQFNIWDLIDLAILGVFLVMLLLCGLLILKHNIKEKIKQRKAAKHKKKEEKENERASGNT